MNLTYAHLSEIYRSIRQFDVILVYHSIGGGSYDHISPDRFRADLRYLTRNYEIVDLPAVSGSSSSRKRVVLTFDDGYRDFYENVVPILHEFNVPATVFVISATLSDDQFVHDDVFEYEYMSPSQLRELVDDDLVTIGNHTRTHPDLSDISDHDVIKSEIIGAKKELETELSTRINRFCYPYYHLNPTSSKVVCRSHDYAVVGYNRNVIRLQNANPCKLPRINGAVTHGQLKDSLTDREVLLRYIDSKMSQL